MLGGVLLGGAAHVKPGFAMFVIAGLILLFLGSELARDVDNLSQRLIDEAARSSSLPGRPLSVTRFGGMAMIAIGAGAVIVGILGLVH